LDNFPTTLLLTILALAVVLVVAWLILRGLSRMGVAQNRNGRLKIVESVPVGTRERIVVLQFNSKEYLVGVTANSMVQLDADKAVAMTSDDTTPMR